MYKQRITNALVSCDPETVADAIEFKKNSMDPAEAGLTARLLLDLVDRYGPPVA